MRKATVVIMAVLAAVMTVTEVSAAWAESKVNINTASRRRLEKLPSVGIKIASLIVAYRSANGDFDRMSDLLSIPGIGERRFEALKQVANVGFLADNSL